MKLNLFSHRLVELGGVAGLLHTPYGPPRKTVEKLVSGERGQESGGEDIQYKPLLPRLCIVNACQAV